MKILAGLFATCLVAMPVHAQGDPAPGTDTGKPVQGSEPPADEPPADDPAAAAAKPVATTPEPDEVPEGTAPDKPAEPAPER